MRTFSKLGKIILRVQGVNINRLLTDLRKKDIAIYNTNLVNSREILITIPRNKFDYLFANYSNSCYTISIVKQSYISSFCQHTISKLGLMLGLGFSFLLCFILNMFCFGVYVHCEDVVLSNKINAFLVNEKIIGLSKNTIDNNDLQSKLINEFSELSLVDVAFRGNYLIVNATKKIEPLLQADVVKGEIVAKDSGVVTRIHLISGTPLVKVGDFVQLGQALITNSFVDRLGQVIPCEAKGSVYVKQWYSTTIDYPLHTVEYARTGEKIVKHSLDLFNKKINLKEISKPNGHYEVETKSTYLLQNNILPIKLITTTFYITKPINLDRDFEKDKDYLILEAKEKTKLLCDTTEIIDEKHTISHIGDVYFVTYYMGVELLIT